VVVVGVIHGVCVWIDGEHSVIEVGVVVGAEDQHVLGDVWAVVRVAKGFDVVNLGVPGVDSAL